MFVFVQLCEGYSKVPDASTISTGVRMGGILLEGRSWSSRVQSSLVPR